MLAKTSGVGIVLAARLEDRELRAAVDLQIGVRVDHRVEVARLPGEVEDARPGRDEVLEAVLVAHVGDVDVNSVLDPGDV